MYEITNMYFHCHGFIQYSRHVISKWQFYNQDDLYTEVLKYSNMGFTGMFSVETVLKIIAYGVKVSTQTQFGLTLQFLNSENTKCVITRYKCTLSVTNMVILSIYMTVWEYYQSSKYHPFPSIRY